MHLILFLTVKHSSLEMYNQLLLRIQSKSNVMYYATAGNSVSETGLANIFIKQPLRKAELKSGLINNT